jgi:hypothetical protein
MFYYFMFLWHVTLSYDVSSILNSKHSVWLLIRDYKNKWHSNILRMESSGMIQKVKNYLPEAQKNVG